MIIENDKTIIEGREVTFNSSYADVYDDLKDYIYSSVVPDTNGNGHITFKHQEFYGLKGTCTMYFQKGLLVKISIEPDWSMYSLSDENGNLPPIDVATLRIKKENEAILNSYFEVVEKSSYKKTTYRKDNIILFTSLSSGGELYSVAIQKAAIQ